MVYIYKKTINEKSYYYLRLSKKEKGKTVVRDIAYLGSDIEKIEQQLDKLPQKYKKDIRTAYKTIKRFLEVDYYGKKVDAQKIKHIAYLSKELYKNIEAAKMHFHEKFLMIDRKTKEEVYKQFIIEFAFNTASIEGNTITLQEAHKLLVENRTPKDKTLREIYDIQNTEKVFMMLLDIKEKLTEEIIIKVHDMLLEQIDLRKGYREHDIRIVGSKFDVSPAKYVKTDMGLLLKWFNENKALQPFVRAILFHHKLERIHPFADGNGRTGRMLVNYILQTERYPPLIITQKKRAEYISALRSADHADIFDISPKNYRPVVEFVAKECVDGYWNIFLV